MFRSSLLACLTLLGACSGGGNNKDSAPPPPIVGSVQLLMHQPPESVGLPLLLTDGSVMVQAQTDDDFSYTRWYKLRPDASGSYVNGNWSAIAAIPADFDYSPYAFASAVLADGRVLILGGEYNFNQFELSNKGAIYDPVLNQWQKLTAPSGWDYIGDSQSVVMPDGRFMIGRKLDQQIAILDPATLEWTALASTNKSDFNSEEGWTLMPDGTVFTADVKNASNSERYVLALQQWFSNGSTIVDLHSPSPFGGIHYGGGTYFPPGEIGPSILRPDGTVFVAGSATSGSSHSAIYHPGAGPTDPGSWTVGPDFPNDDAGDTSAVLLPNGHVLNMGTSGRLYEFDGEKLLPGPVLANGANHVTMMLPNGETLITGNIVQVYRSATAANPAWAPVIGEVPTVLTRGNSYTVSGTQFNGMSQAAAFGDELETATNYPLLRITNKASGHVFYARTHEHSSMGVATGSVPVFTHFDLPLAAETGPATLQVSANGISSAGVDITVD